MGMAPNSTMWCHRDENPVSFSLSCLKACELSLAEIRMQAQVSPVRAVPVNVAIIEIASLFSSETELFPANCFHHCSR